MGLGLLFLSRLERRRDAGNDDDADPRARKERNGFVKGNPTDEGREDDGGELKAARDEDVAAAPCARHGQLRDDARNGHPRERPDVVERDGGERSLPEKVSDHARHGAREREVKNDAPRGFAHFGELSHLKLRERGEETRGRTDEARHQVARPHVGPQNERDAEKAEDDAGDEFLLQGLSCAYGEVGDDRGHEERARVVEGHGRAERQSPERVNPDEERERPEETSLQMRGNEVRHDRAVRRDDPEENEAAADDLTIKDELERAEVRGAELRERRHQRKEKG